MVTAPLKPNPFIAGSIITDPRLFIGRRQELQTLATLMSETPPTSVNIVGDRYIGKSSLLYHFFQTWPQWLPQGGRYALAYVSLRDTPCGTEGAFYRVVARHLLKDPVLQSERYLKEVLGAPAFTAQSFFNAMVQCRIEEVLPVLCLDDFEQLIERPRSFSTKFFDLLRSLIRNGYIMLIATSPQPIEHYIQARGLTTTLGQHLHEIRLDVLPEGEVDALVQLPVGVIPDAQPALNPDNQQRAIHWGGQHPYLLQLAARYLMEAQSKNRQLTWAKLCFMRRYRRVFQRGAPNHPRWWAVFAWVRSLLRVLGHAVTQALRR